LDQLKKAQLVIAEGREELAAATEKIELAQKIIDESADALRDNPASSFGRANPSSLLIWTNPPGNTGISHYYAAAPLASRDPS
jgi:hypothetical protein